MLALTRKKGESIMVSDIAEIIVLGIQGEQVRLGIIAPRHVPIHRKEVYEQIRMENKEASGQINKAALKAFKKK
jgi:carbon storage regulator